MVKVLSIKECSAVGGPSLSTLVQARLKEDHIRVGGREVRAETERRAVKSWL